MFKLLRDLSHDDPYLMTVGEALRFSLQLIPFFTTTDQSNAKTLILCSINNLLCILDSITCEKDSDTFLCLKQKIAFNTKGAIHLFLSGLAMKT